MSDSRDYIKALNNIISTMKTISDVYFSRFLSNDLSLPEMLKVEKDLISNGEGDAVIHACIMNYLHNRELADKLLGTDVDISEELYKHADTTVKGSGDHYPLGDGIKRALGSSIVIASLRGLVKYTIPQRVSRLPGIAANSFSGSNSDRYEGHQSLTDRDNTLKNYIMSKTTVIGEEGMNVKDPIFIQQPDDHSCALRSQQIILRDFGIDIPFDDLERFALEHNIYSEDGTYMFDVGKVMEAAGVPVHATTGNTMDDLMRELSQGHRVIVGVDANELWYNETLGEQFKNFFDDVFGVQGGNHALIVAGFEIDPSDPSNISVVLTDPGSGELRVTYPAKQFSNAWADSNCFMVATDNPAPYQYDPETHMEVPSNFYVEQHMNEWIQEHSYQLNPDMINLPDNYSAHYTAHNTEELYTAIGVDPALWDDDSEPESEPEPGDEPGPGDEPEYEPEPEPGDEPEDELGDEPEYEPEDELGDELGDDTNE